MLNQKVFILLLTVNITGVIVIIGHCSRSQLWKSVQPTVSIENKSQMVACIERLTINSVVETSIVEFPTTNSSSSSNNTSSSLWIVFMGDSRIRQQFYSLLRILPDYDRIWDGQPDDRITTHYDMEVTSPLLNLRISFKWRPVVSQDVVQEIKNWTLPIDQQHGEEAVLPAFLFIGMNVHHMFPIYDTVPIGPQVYNDNLKALATELHQLTLEGVQVVWLISQPTLDLAYFLMYAEHLRENFVSLEKVVNYNKVARDILSQESPGVQIVEHNKHIAMEYLRSCWNNQRSEFRHYRQCLDWVHLGYSVIDQNTPRLVNLFLCPSVWKK